MIREQELIEKLDTSPMIRSQFLKSTLFNQSQSMRFTTQDLRESDDFTLKFESCFESGNLFVAQKVSD